MTLESQIRNYITQLVMTSSIEVLIMDQVEYMMVQNFDNIFPILDKLNQVPRGGGECVKTMNSTLRVYEWALAKEAKKYRQNIVISATLHPFIKKLMYTFHSSFSCRYALASDTDTRCRLPGHEHLPASPANRQNRSVIAGRTTLQRR